MVNTIDTNHNRFIDGQLLAIQATTTSMAQKTMGHRSRQVESTTTNSLFSGFFPRAPVTNGALSFGKQRKNPGKKRLGTFGMTKICLLKISHPSATQHKKMAMSANGIETFPRHRAHNFAMEKGDNDDDAPGRQLKTPFFPVLKKQRPWRGWSRRGTVFLYLTFSSWSMFLCLRADQY